MLGNANIEHQQGDRNGNHAITERLDPGRLPPTGIVPKERSHSPSPSSRSAMTATLAETVPAARLLTRTGAILVANRQLAGTTRRERLHYGYLRRSLRHQDRPRSSPGQRY